MKEIPPWLADVEKVSKEELKQFIEPKIPTDYYERLEMWSEIRLYVRDEFEQNKKEIPGGLVTVLKMFGDRLF